MDIAKENDPNEYFLKCLAFFSTQDPNTFIEKADSFFVMGNTDSSWHVNRDHPFWNDYPDAVWAMRAMADEFLLQFQRISGKRKSNDDWQELYRNINIRLEQQVISLIRGLELDVITAISGERYESKEGKELSMSFLPYPLDAQCLSYYGAMVLEPDAQIPLNRNNVHAIRKQLNLSVHASLAVCYLSGNAKPEDGLYVVGVIPDEARTAFPRIYFKGHMEWELHLPRTKDADTACVLRYHQGLQMLPILSTEKADQKMLRQCLSRQDARTRAGVLKIIQAARSLKGGAVLIFANKSVIEQECIRLCREAKRGITITPCDLSAPTTDDLERLTSVDGAILVSFDLKCRAYGVILDGLVDINKSSAVKGDPSRGARFNSTKIYIANQQNRHPEKDFLGVVVSEDGMVNFFPCVAEATQHEASKK